MMKGLKTFRKIMFKKRVKMMKKTKIKNQMKKK